jgi:hypothetical protein
MEAQNADAESAVRPKTVLAGSGFQECQDSSTFSPRSGTSLFLGQGRSAQGIFWAAFPSQSFLCKLHLCELMQADLGEGVWECMRMLCVCVHLHMYACFECASICVCV